MTRTGALHSRWWWWGVWTSGPWTCPEPCPSQSHSPELSLQVHKVLFGQGHTGAGVDDQGLAVLEVGCFEPPFGQLGKGPEPMRRGRGPGRVPPTPSIERIERRSSQ